MNEHTVYLKDYTPYPFHFPGVELTFDLDPTATRVHSKLTFARAEGAPKNDPMVLNGEELTTRSIAINGIPLSDDDYTMDGEILTIHTPPKEGTLEIEVTINPQENTLLSGLYISDNTFCTQNEAEGFRRITWYPDRPDVLSVFTTTIRGSKERCPHMLSNGNFVEHHDLPDGRHSVTWHDPFPKPSYLYALVGGDLAMKEDRYTTLSGREITLRIFVDHGSEDKTGHAFASLKRAMRWDEETFGLEYDLDLFMIVAVDAFNFGAMENKGLNIFNSKAVLANPETTTDAEFITIERIVAHEYFHNWTGDRITCRDWFQLTLKEGLTVYRDQEYISDQTNRSEIRIDSVRALKQNQFAEDASPLAHPIRPSYYEAIDNFYTQTVYQKGKEVIRMIHTIIGDEAFKRGMRLYVERHDGQAVTTDHFVQAMEDAGGVDLRQFRETWYTQAGTPEITVEDHYDTERQEYTLTVSQHCRRTPETTEKRPYHIPMALGLLDDNGIEIEIPEEMRLLSLKKERETFCFTDITTRPVPSLLRDFSAPVTVRYPYTTEQLLLLMHHDSDPFNRHDAGQQLLTKTILSTEPIDPRVLEALAYFLSPEETDLAFNAKMLTLPSIELLSRATKHYDVPFVHQQLLAFETAFAVRYRDELEACYSRIEIDRYELTQHQIAQRALRNVVLTYLVKADDRFREVALTQFRTADNMTDQLAGIVALRDRNDNYREAALSEFFEKWQDNKLVLNNWFAIQAGSDLPTVLNEVRSLEQHPAFDPKNPNKVRALIGAFAGNLPAFHAADGSGYHYLADKVIKIDGINSHIAAGLATAFRSVTQLSADRAQVMREAIDHVLAKTKISKNVREILGKL